MQPNPGRDGRPSDLGVRTDGGSPMPGVPDEDGAPESSNRAADNSPEPTSSSDSRMPGVPASQGPKPAVESGGDSFEAPDHVEESEETHDLTTAFTLAALRRLENPAGVVSEARSWSDWVGVIGAVDAPTLNTFLRRKTVDIDFFNGAGPPEDRLERIAAEASAFHSERLVLVGTTEQADMAAEAGWEFQGLEETAATAGWELK